MPSIFKSCFLISSLFFILFLSCFFSSPLFAQENDSIQELATLLPEETLFFASIPNITTLLQQIERLPAGKISHNAEVKKVISLFYKYFFRGNDAVFFDKILNETLSFLEKLDRGISFVGYPSLTSAQTDPHLILIARSSTATKMQEFMTSFTPWLLGDTPKQIFAHSIDGFQIKEIRLRQKSYYYCVIEQTLIAGQSIESISQIASVFKPNTQKGNSLVHDSSFRQASEDVNRSRENVFFLYSNFGKIISKKSDLPHVVFNPGIERNEISTIGSLRTLSTAQNQFQNACVKDRDLDGVGEYGYFTELAGIHPVPVGEHEGSRARPAFISSIFGQTSLKNGGIAQRNGYNYLIYLSAEKESIRENGKPVPPNKNNISENEINSQETLWACYAWPIEKGNTGNRCFKVNQTGILFESEDATYQGFESIPATVDKEGNSQDSFQWKEYSYSNKNSSSKKATSSFLEWVSFFHTTTSKDLGLDQLQTLSVAITFKENQVQDKVALRFKEKSRLLSLFSKTPNSFRSANLSLPKTIFYSSLKLTSEEITKFLLEMVAGKSGTANMLDEFQKNFKFSMVNDFFDLIGDEISLFISPPQYGLIPNVALIVPLNNPEKFFANVETLLKSQNDYALKNTDYLNHRVYYLQKAQGQYFSFSFIPSFTYLKEHLILSYDPATIKMMIKLQTEPEKSFAETERWQNAQQQTQGKHQGVLFFDTKEIFSILYDIMYQISLFFPQVDIATLPLTEDLAQYLNSSSTWIDCTEKTFTLTSQGDGFSPGILGLGMLEILSVSPILEIYSNTPRKNKAPVDSFSGMRERADHSKCKSNLRQLATALQLFVDSRGKGSRYPPPDKIKFISILYRSEVMIDEEIYVCPSTGNSTSGELLREDTIDCTDYEATEYAIWTSRNAQEFPIMWDKEGNHPDGMRNVVFLDVSARTMKEEEFQAMMKKHQEWVEANKDAMLRAKERSEKFFEGKFK